MKMKFEKGQIDTTDLITIGELENFEDKNGNGSYKASFGHDDSIMTFVQIPALEQTAKYKEWLEDFESSQISNNIDSKWNNSNQNPYLDFSSSSLLDLYNLHQESFALFDISKQ